MQRYVLQRDKVWDVYGVLRFLWLQEQIKDGKIDIVKVDTAENRADILTKSDSNGQQFAMLRWQLGVEDPEWNEEQ